MAQERIAAKADTHVRKDRASSREHFSGFVEACLASSTEIVILNGDILDQKATYDDITFVLQGIGQLVASGKQVVFIKGNHEDRLREQPQHTLYSGLQDSRLVRNVHVLENERTVLSTKDGREVAIVGFPCVLTPEEQKQLNALAPDIQPAAMQQLLEGKYADAFEEQMQISSQENIPTLVVFHNPMLYESYGNALQNASGLQVPGRFANAMDPRVVFAVVHGHLHGNPIAGIPQTQTAEDIIILNDAQSVAKGPVAFEIPHTLADIPRVREAMRRTLPN